LIEFDDGHKNIFRIYVRDHEAIPKEKYIYQLAHKTIPMPKILNSDTHLKNIMCNLVESTIRPRHVKFR